MVKRHLSVSVGLLWEKHEINSNRRAVTPRSLPICGGQGTGTEVLAAILLLWDAGWKVYRH